MISLQLPDGTAIQVEITPVKEAAIEVLQKGYQIITFDDVEFQNDLGEKYMAKVPRAYVPEDKRKEISAKIREVFNG